MGDEDVDTGFAEVIENPNAVWKDEAPVPALLNAVALPDLTPTELAKLAREIAMDIKEVPKILEHYKLSEAQYDHLKIHNEFFKQALHVCTIEWNSALTTPERIKLESAAILEEALPRLGARMANQAEGLPGVVEAAKLFAKIAGVGERDMGDRAPGERFTISINLGGDDKLVYNSKEPAPNAVDKTAVSIGVSND